MISLRKLPDEPWHNWVKRIVIHTPIYLSYDGKSITTGGRQRTVKDLSEIIQKKLKKECLVLQKAKHPFKLKDQYGTEVIGFPVPHNSKGDPILGYKTAKFLSKGDAIIYVGGEDAWPFFVKNSKGYHVGVWWDGPISYWKKAINAIRTESMFISTRSMCCCDTNVINWLRTRRKKYFDFANKAIYIPNYVDLERLDLNEKKALNKVPKILFARRLDIRRGIWLMLDSFRILRTKGVDVELIICSPEGQEVSFPELIRRLKQMNLENHVKIYSSYNLDNIYSIYNNIDISVIPTIWSEGTSYTCIESIAAGIPVITTTVGGLPNLVIPDFNGYVVPPLADEIANSIIKLLDEKKWDMMHKNCLSMRNAFSKSLWQQRIIDWIMS